MFEPSGGSDRVNAEFTACGYGTPGLLPMNALMRLPAKSAGARQGAAAQSMPFSRAKVLKRLGRRLRAQDGFTIVEVMVAALVLTVGLGATMLMLVTSSHVIKTTRLRQEETSIAREVLEDARNVAYTSLNSSSLASAIQSMIPNSKVSGTGLVVTRAIAPSAGNYDFNVSLSACSLDSPSDGYGSHTAAPASGGSWCTDVASSGSTDTNPDDYKRVSATVTPSTLSTPTVQQTVLIYSRPVNGPAVSCLSTTSTCPGANVTVTTGTSTTFNVTTTSDATDVQWYVNGNQPTSAQLSSGEDDPYTPSGTGSTFTWVYPTTTYNATKYTIDGTYTITAVAYDANGNAGTSSTIQVSVNQHQAIPPATFMAGWNDQMNGYDFQWVPSVDQDIQTYEVYEQYNGSTGWNLVSSCTVNATSCTDTSSTAQSEAPPATSSRGTCTTGTQSTGKKNQYYVVGVDKDTSGNLRVSTWTSSPNVDGNACDHPPTAPTNLTGTLSGGQLTLNWTGSTDPDSWDSVQAYRIYRWASTGTMQDPGSRYQLVGTSTSSPVTTYTDGSPDPGGVTQSYCVTAVDSHLDESPCSGTVTG
jgi:Tfp pilus assembly protein PilV